MNRQRNKNMRCPNCGKTPLSFTKFLVTLNPMRISCQHCGTPLRAGLLAYLWTVMHLPLGLGLVTLHAALRVNGTIRSGGEFAVFLIAVAGFVFLTAYVIPWVAFRSLYRVAT